MNVYAATQAFGSELRVHLIHYYAESTKSTPTGSVN
jgi:hypothetical protein